MWYMPYVRVRRAVLIYAFIILGITLVAVAFRWWPGVVQAERGHETDLSGMQISVSMLLSGAAALVGGLATVLGLNLAAENDGHLELAWTKPVSREGYALGVFAVDLVAMAACIVFTAACAALVADIYIGHQAVAMVSANSFEGALAFCGFPLCVYAWITALSASLKRNRGGVAGLFWPLMIAIAALSLVPFPAVHAVASALDRVNPLAIYASSSVHTRPIAVYLSGWAVSAILLGAALAQWRRLEA